nr:MAG TPA: hypothetical protein [Caudoviricetes sp.]
MKIVITCPSNSFPNNPKKDIDKSQLWDYTLIVSNNNKSIGNRNPAPSRLLFFGGSEPMVFGW